MGGGNCSWLGGAGVAAGAGAGASRGAWTTTHALSEDPSPQIISALMTKRVLLLLTIIVTPPTSDRMIRID